MGGGGGEEGEWGAEATYRLREGRQRLHQRLYRDLPPHPADVLVHRQDHLPDRISRRLRRQAGSCRLALRPRPGPTRRPERRLQA